MNENMIPSTRDQGRHEGIYRFLDVCLSEVRRLGGLPTAREAQQMWGDIWLRETHHSTGLEGNALSLTEVEALLQGERTVDETQRHDYLEVRGYADAAQWVYTQAVEPDEWATGQAISLSALRHLHHIALSPVWEHYPHPDAGDNERPGSFRRHDIKPFPGGMQPPDWPAVPVVIRDWVDDVNRFVESERAISTTGSARTVEAVAQQHAAFERIHPFLDGNGRTGRLLLNLMLVSLHYPPAIILKERRDAYLDALHRCDEGDVGLLGECIARAIVHTLKLVVFPAIAGPGRYILLSVLADEEFSPNRLAEAARSGKFQAEKDEDGFWRSTPRLVGEYKASCRRRTNIAGTSRR